MNELCNVYGLIDTRSKRIFYIGCTRDAVLERTKVHITNAKYPQITQKTFRHTLSKNETILNILNEGKNVEYIILCTCSKNEADYYEQLFYDLLVKAGNILHQRKNVGYK
jgi:hypothetical protein